jgi:hypothetical protein
MALRSAQPLTEISTWNTLGHSQTVRKQEEWRHLKNSITILVYRPTFTAYTHVSVIFFIYFITSLLEGFQTGMASVVKSETDSHEEGGGNLYSEFLFLIFV